MPPTRRLITRAARSAALASAAVIALLLSGCTQTPPDPEAYPLGSSTHTIVVDGQNRDYRVYRPAGAADHAPLVVMLHGGFGSAEQAEKVYGWDAQADVDGFVVAYPDGEGRAWNAGGGCCGSPGNRGVDDVAFIAAMVRQLESSLETDPRRRYATGMSNGAIMAYRLACETDLFAAIGPVAGTLLAECSDPQPTSVLAIHGLADTSVPVDGSAGDGAVEIDGAPVADVVASWRGVDGCAEPVATDAGVVSILAAECPDGRSVELVTIAEAGHQWPGAPSSDLRDELGGDPPSTALDATAELAAFFLGHPRV